jgi:hypothetical protein
VPNILKGFTAGQAIPESGQIPENETGITCVDFSAKALATLKFQHLVSPVFKKATSISNQVNWTKERISGKEKNRATNQNTKIGCRVAKKKRRKGSAFIKGLLF